MQHQQYLNIHHQQQTEQEMTEEEERNREYRELRISSRINRGIDNVDGQSTLSNGLLWMIDDTHLSQWTIMMKTTWISL